MQIHLSFSELQIIARNNKELSNKLEEFNANNLSILEGQVTPAKGEKLSLLIRVHTDVDVQDCSDALINELVGRMQ